MAKEVLGILPAAGMATRMGGIPKFLMPSSRAGEPLLMLHVEALASVVDRLVIVVRPEFAVVLTRMGLPDGITVLVATTDTMSQTVQHALRVGHDESILGMPDTDIFDVENPYARLAGSTGLDPWTIGIWKTAEWQLGKLGATRVEEGAVVEVRDKSPDWPVYQHWGLLKWTKDQDTFIHPEDPHVGYALSRAIHGKQRASAIMMEGSYWDLGTPSEYGRYLAQGTT